MYILLFNIPNSEKSYRNYVPVCITQNSVTTLINDESLQIVLLPTASFFGTEHDLALSEAIKQN